MGRRPPNLGIVSDLVPNNAFGRRVLDRLREEKVVWFTTIAEDGTPQPNPVWFVWHPDGTVLVYNRRDARRLAHIARQPRVALHFDGDGHGGNIVVLTGTARVAADEPPPHENPSYLAKYKKLMTKASGSPSAFSTAYPDAVHIEVDRLRGF